MKASNVKNLDIPVVNWVIISSPPAGCIKTLRRIKTIIELDEIIAKLL